MSGIIAPLYVPAPTLCNLVIRHTNLVHGTPLSELHPTHVMWYQNVFGTSSIGMVEPDCPNGVIKIRHLMDVPTCVSYINLDIKTSEEHKKELMSELCKVSFLLTQYGISLLEYDFDTPVMEDWNTLNNEDRVKLKKELDERRAQMKRISDKPWKNIAINGKGVPLGTCQNICRMLKTIKRS